MDKGLQTVLAVIGGVAGFLMFRLSGWPVETKLAALLAIAVALVGYPIGWLAGRYVAKDFDVDGAVFLAVSAVGLLGFLLPVVGMAMSAVICQFYKQSERHRLLYAGMSSLVCLLAGDTPPTARQRPCQRWREAWFALLNEAAGRLQAQ